MEKVTHISPELVRPDMYPPVSMFYRELSEWCLLKVLERYPYPECIVDRLYNLTDDGGIAFHFYNPVVVTGYRVRVGTFVLKFLDGSDRAALSCYTNVHPNFRGLGVATWMMRLKLCLLYQHGVRLVTATVGDENIPEKRLLIKWGWMNIASIGEHAALWSRSLPRFEHHITGIFNPVGHP